jgi:hypothetical protein
MQLALAATLSQIASKVAVEKSNPSASSMTALLRYESTNTQYNHCTAESHAHSGITDEIVMLLERHESTNLTNGA